MSVVSSNILAGASGQSTDTSYEIKKGLRFNSGDSAYMSRTPDTEGNRRTWTWSAWVKRSKIAGDNQPFLTANSSTGNSFFMGWHGYYSDGREDALEINNVAGVGDGYITSGVYRDTSAWYHVVVAFDSTQSTAGDRIQCFINGVQQTWQQTVNGPNQNDEWKVNDTIAHTIGDTANSFTGQGKLDSYLADVQFIDGSALLPTVFGEYDSNGVWQPKEVTEADLVTAKESQAPSGVTWDASKTWSGGLSTSNIQAHTTKYLFNGNISANGWADHTYAYAATQGTAASITGITTPTGSIRIRGYKNNAGSQFTINGGNTYSFSATNTTEWISITETSITSITFNTTGTTYLSGIEVGGKLLVDGGWGTNGFHLPFDDGTDIGKDTAVTAPTLDPRGGFDAVTYTGTGAYNQVSNLRFAPDLVWIKDRSAGNHHYLVDSVRGVGTSEALFPDRNVAAGDGTQRVSSLNSDGFSVFGTYGYTNTNGSNYAAWCWKAGGAAVSNTDGTITSTVSADQNYGFSVVQFDVGTPSYTVGHGLGSEPKFMIFKSKSAGSTNWNVYHVSTGNQSRSYLNLTNAASSGEACWNSTSPTSSVFSMGSSGEFSGTMMAYCWSEIAGFSKMGSYSGSSNPVTVNTGFAPKFILIKSDDTAGQEWIIKDRARGFDKYLIPNNSDAEATGRNVTFNSDGFTVDSGQGPTNWSGRNYIYVAFADYPGNDFTPHNIITEDNTSAKNNFGAFTWTGNSTAGTVIDTGFQPDLVWVKARGAADVGGLFDSVRGATKYVIPSSNAAEGTDANAISSFTSSGFTLGTGYTSIATNNNAATYAGWAWKAGGTASSNTNGTITSSVSANPNFGFSIVTYTGSGSNATIGHGLSSPPKMIFVRRRDSTGGTYVYHASPGPTKTGYLYGTSLFETYAAAYNDTAPTTSVFSVGTAAATNASGGTYVAYCWSEVPGYSRFSSYVGNGSSTGPVIDCGFKPAFLLIKAQIAGEDWTMHDSNRGSQNIFFANTNDAELSSSAYDVEFTDTGFQIKNTNPRFNTSGSTYYYAAFAEPTYGDLDLVNDTPTANAEDPVKGNYATLNPIDKGSNSTLSNGNLYVVKSGTTWASCGVRGTIGVTSGKYYWEITKNNSAQYSVFGVAEISASYSDTYTAPVNGIWGYISNSGNKLHGSDGGAGASYGASFTTGDVIGVALDMDAGTLVFYKNGVSQGTAYTNLSGKTIFPWVHLYTDTDSAIFNFGQQPFKYTPPAGYKKLCTTNLPDPTIEDGSKHFDAKLWTGDGNATRNISSYEFNPGFVWIKERPANGWQHVLYDVIRGPGTSSVTKSLSSDQNRSEASGNDTNHGFLSGFISNGFQLTKGSQASGDYVNHSGWAYVGWAWDAGSSNTSITAGSLNSSIYDQTSTWSNTLTVAVDQDQTWSNYLTSSTGSFSGAATNAFDNSHSNANTSTAYPSGANESVTFDISALSENLTGELEVFTWCDDSTAATKYTQIQVFEGGSSTASFTGNAHKVNTDNYQWCAPLGIFTNITKIIVSGINAGGAYFGGVSVNGIELVDNGVSVTGFPGGYPATAAFNGVNNSNGGAARTNSPPNGIKYKHPASLTVTTLEMKCYYSNTIWLPDGTKTSVAANSGNDVWYQVPIGSGFTFDGSNYLTIERTGFANYTYLDGIRLNGKELVDTGVSLGNVPTIASTVRANPSAGFSVVTYTGTGSNATVGHGLNAPPYLVIVKRRDSAGSWIVWHNAFGAASNTDYLYLNSNIAKGGDGSNAFWNSTVPTSSVFSVGTGGSVNASSATYVAYCFAPVAGYSKFGSYIGNGQSTEGPFVYTGFRPRYIMWKCSSGSGQWFIHDTARSPYNYSDLELAADSAADEYSASGVGAGERLDFLSNGFKVRTANSASNSSGATYIYAAFAENPFKSSRAR